MNLLPHFVAPLFVPADRPERFAKAAASGADAIIIDLEDAVAAPAKDAARAALSAAFASVPILVRINAAGTSWHREDLDAVAKLPFAAIMVPKAERLADLAEVAKVLPVVALVETVKGIAAARAIAQSGHVRRLAFGSIDYAADLGCAHVREALVHARAEVVFASKLGALPPPLDGVTTDVSDGELASADAVYARALGFGGKMLIHPGQVAPVLESFRLHDEEVAWARRVLESGDGVVQLDGEMVDEPVRVLARSIIARAQSEPLVPPLANMCNRAAIVP